MSVTEICRQAAQASAVVGQLTTKQKNEVLLGMAAAIERRQAEIMAANARDVESAAAAGYSSTIVDRLTLTTKRMSGLATAVRVIAGLPDPVGQVVGGWTAASGLLIERVRNPLGVVAIIYEARPTVTAEAAALCLKSGNCTVLRGSTIAEHSNVAIVAAMAAAIAEHPAVPSAAVQLVTDLSREAALELMRAKDFVDLLVPRGGTELIAAVEKNATVPTVIDGEGNCHVYIDSSADPGMAAAIAINAKTSRPSVCNAMETLLVHEALAESWLPGVLDELAAAGVEIRGCRRVAEVWPKALAATEDDWGREYLDLVLAVRVVRDVEEAIAHIGRWGTRNAEGVVTRDIDIARRFAAAVDAGSVFVNASTRYSDGGEFGFGVEIGVSTQKLHVRGPMGLEALTTVKNVVWGTGQTRIV